MVIHSEKRPVTEYVCLFKEPSSLGTVSIIPKAGMSVVEKQELVIKRREKPNVNTSECFDKFPVTHRSHDPLSNVLLLRNKTYGWSLKLLLQPFSPSFYHSPRMTSLMFYAYQRFQRSNQFNTSFCCSHLFRRYVVYQFCKV